MRKLLLALLALLIAAPAWAAGTLTVTGPVQSNAAGNLTKVVTVSWVANAGDASVGSATINVGTSGTKPMSLEGWYLYSADLVVGTTTATADIVVGDTYNTDWSNGGLANVGSITGAAFNFGTAPWGFKKVKAATNLTVTVSNNAQNGATGSIILTFVPE